MLHIMNVLSEINSDDSDATVDLSGDADDIQIDLHDAPEIKFKPLGTAIIEQTNDGKTTLRRVIVYSYEYENEKKITAFYESSGTSHGTNKMLANTFFPFYGETILPNGETHLVKAPELVQRDNYLSIIEWVYQLKQSKIFVPKDIIKYFNNFTELQISARLNTGWWTFPNATHVKSAVLSHFWNGLKYIKMQKIPLLTQRKVEQYFNTTPPPTILHFNSGEINEFLDKFGARRNKRERAVDVDPDIEPDIATKSERKGGKKTRKKRRRTNRKKTRSNKRKATKRRRR
jgi:hypothetical protein